MRAQAFAALMVVGGLAGGATAGDPVNDEVDALFTFAQANLFGRAPHNAPNGAAGVPFYECHQDVGSEFCNVSFPSRDFFFWVSSCDEDFLSCSGLTARVRLLVEDDVTAPDVIDCTFEGGVIIPLSFVWPGCAWVSGDHQVEGQVLFRVRTLPIRDGVPLQVGAFHVWLTNAHPQ